MASTAAGKQRIPKVAKVKNKAPAEVQITAEQLLREAKERELELLPPPPKQKITDEEELNDYKLRKRKTFEDNIRKNRTVISNWIKYAQWEESLKEVQRARSIYERALDVDHRNITLWLKYAEMEMKNRQVNHARNIWDRAIIILPRVNQFWYKYTYMEELLGNVAGARMPSVSCAHALKRIVVFHAPVTSHARERFLRAEDPHQVQLAGFLAGDRGYPDWTI
ncbi:hypothetical protein AB205_0061070 [Aquarana catesbeiana]|uniref:Pre-mRNA-splicing factor Syf1-like N-terminal HAT-repeats domain-containing protein n=1 Tax=Aquarana catesbeiana TaxID=8400 RepID=A0A2G9PP41_AQUCT|nr:hypothetical protein AB205_0061070 [Aquarana catesbeiana]